MIRTLLAIAIEKPDALPNVSLAHAFQVVANTLIFLTGAIAVIMLIIGGMRYTLSNGNPQSVKGAKDTILYALIGVVVAILAYAAVQFVITRFTK